MTFKDMRESLGAEIKLGGIVSFKSILGAGGGGVVIGTVGSDLIVSGFVTEKFTSGSMQGIFEVPYDQAVYYKEDGDVLWMPSDWDSSSH